MKRLNVLAVVLMALAAPASAQQGQGGTPQPGRSAPTPAPSTTILQSPPRGFNRGQPMNVRLDITINDQSSTGHSVKKTITMLIADRSSGRVRSSGMVHQQVQRGIGPDGNPVVGMVPQYSVELNVDASIELLGEINKMVAQITLEYTPGAVAISTNESPRPSPLNQSVTVILQNGKPLIITQAADPISDRKITVEVVATILP